MVQILKYIHQSHAQEISLDYVCQSSHDRHEYDSSKIDILLDYIGVQLMSIFHTPINSVPFVTEAGGLYLSC